MSKTKKTSVGRRGFLQGAAAIVATAQSVSNNAVAQNSQNSLGPAAGQEWLALTEEAALEPQLPIIDPHHHLWDDPDRMPQRYLYTIDHFGPGRCMFESNFPVDRLSCSYTVLWNQFKKLTKDFSAGERSAMFHDTASRVYRLPRA